MLYMIGIGLNDETDISVKGLETVKKCDSVYLECYTSKLSCSIDKLEKFYGRKIIPADRNIVENKAEETILKDAKEGNCAFLVIGDVFGATTHTDLWIRARNNDIKCEVINNVSIINAVGIAGLELYKYGKVTSIPFENEEVITPYNVLLDNQKLGMHTLFLLDLNPQENRFLSIKDAVEFLEKTEKRMKKGIISKNTLGIGCAHIGSKQPTIFYGKLSEIKEKDFGNPPYCLIIPGKMHFIEEEAVSFWK